MTRLFNLLHRAGRTSFGLLLVFFLTPALMAHAQSSSTGAEVNACVLNTVDAYNDVEETVCLTGNSSEVDAEAAVDSWAYEDHTNWPNGDGYVNDLSAEVIVSGVLDSGVQSDPPTGTGSFTPSLYTYYTAEGYYGEYYDSTGAFCGGGCTWIGPYDSGLWAAVTVLQWNPTSVTITVTPNSGVAPSSGGSVSYSQQPLLIAGTVNITNANSGAGYSIPALTGPVIMWDENPSGYYWSGYPTSRVLGETVTLPPGTYKFTSGYYGDIPGAEATNQQSFCYPSSCATFTLTVN
ncbi:MAG TPA: hypothetical protein VN612_07350 [Acidobacteriaceae bacterium]|nr:hypothetical protein [Acidobacteriaceae bacterium]